MLSLYIHIPFCNRKCEYCNFFVIAKDNPHRQDTMIDEYLTGLHAEIDHRASRTPQAEIKTIYFGGGTPGILSLSQLTSIIDHIRRVRNCKNLGEISIELNPDPFEHTIELVTGLTSYYKDVPRVRCSFGIQTFDDAVLKQAGRDYVFNNIRHFLRDLREIKQATNVFNLDFIAFGTRDQRSPARREFLHNMIMSQSFDSYSLYLLELFPGSKWHSLLHQNNLSPLVHKLVNPDETAIMEEYDNIASLLHHAGYNQYEASNRALAGKDSIHNHVYRNMESYLGLGASASGLVDSLQLTQHDNATISSPGISAPNPGLTRYTNTSNLSHYLKGEYIDESKTIELDHKTQTIEKLMLALRTSHGIQQLSQYQEHLTPSRQTLVQQRQDDGLALYHDDWLSLTHSGFKISNHLITDLLEF